MKKTLKKAAKPAVNDVQSSVRRQSSTGQSGFPPAPRPRISLRDSIAKSIKVAFKSSKSKHGVFLRVDRKKFAAISGRVGESGEKLPKYLEGSWSRWKHPVFGQKMDKPQTWPIQKPKPFFRNTIDQHKPEFQRAVQIAFTEAFADIDKKLDHKN